MGSTRELLGRVARGPVAASLFAAVLVALLIAEFVRPRQEVAPSKRLSPDDPVLLAPTGKVALPRPLRADEKLVVDRSSTGDSGLLGASVNEKLVTIFPLAPDPGSGLSTSLSFETQVQATAVQVGSLDGERVAFAIENRGARTVVERHNLSGGGSLRDSVESLPIERVRGGSRDARIATWSGSEPDLFLVDRGLPNGKMAVRVLSGESEYRKVLLDVKVAAGNGFRPEEWALDVGPGNGDRPDILLVTTGRRTPSRSTEAHVLSGEQGYSRFLAQTPSVLQDERPGGRAALGYRDGSLVWFSATAGSRLLQVFSLSGRRSRSAG